MLFPISDGSSKRLLLAGIGLILASMEAQAGNEANFVLYDHHTEKAGTVSAMLLNDFSRNVPGEPPYAAQMLMIERAMTDRWETELMVQSHKVSGEEFQSTAGWRWENRFRLFDYGTFLNPVLYVEYENLNPRARYLMEVSGRTDKPEGPDRIERILETRLILGQDISDKLSVSFNWINETDLRGRGETDFGYALGLNYTVYNAGMPENDGDRAHGKHGDHAHSNHGHRDHGSANDAWKIAHIKIGGELFGGLGDTVLGLTANPSVTQHYAGLNTMIHLQNGLHFMLGIAAGVTSVSERGLIRLGMGVEFE